MTLLGMYFGKKNYETTRSCARVKIPYLCASVSNIRNFLFCTHADEGRPFEIEKNRFNRKFSKKFSKKSVLVGYYDVCLMINHEERKIEMISSL